VPREPLHPPSLRGELEKLHAASFGWALGCCRGRRAEAEDALQTAYWKILTGRARFDGRADFKTWLFAVIRKTAIDLHRRAVFRRWCLLESSVAVESLAPAAEPESSPDQLAMQDLFRQALDALPSRQREVLHLVFYQHMTVQQAADIMGVSVGSARTHYERGKRRLRARLETSPFLHETGLTRPDARLVV
jgi:RNA polymerase sigma-70 factor (ECF subfamily)